MVFQLVRTLTGNAGVTLTAVMTRKPKPPVAIYSALADASRCRIVEILKEGAQPVHELAEAFSISRPAISRHLRVLKTAGLVVEVKKGRENLYSLRAARLDKASSWISTIRGTADEPEPSVVDAAPAPAAVDAIVPPVAMPTTDAEPKRRRRSTPAASAESVLPADDIAPVAARAASKAVSQMGFDF